MFDSKSRYYNLKNKTMTLANGKTVTVKERRFLPQGTTMSRLADVIVNRGDRLDQITARTLGDPEQYWRVADANNALDPFALVVIPGDIVRIPVPTLG